MRSTTNDRCVESVLYGIQRTLCRNIWISAPKMKGPRTVSPTELDVRKTMNTWGYPRVHSQEAHKHTQKSSPTLQQLGGTFNPIYFICGNVHSRRSSSSLSPVGFFVVDDLVRTQLLHVVNLANSLRRLVGAGGGGNIGACALCQLDCLGDGCITRHGKTWFSSSTWRWPSCLKSNILTKQPVDLG